MREVAINNGDFIHASYMEDNIWIVKGTDCKIYSTNGGSTGQAAEQTFPSRQIIELILWWPGMLQKMYLGKAIQK